MSGRSDSRHDDAFSTVPRFIRDEADKDAGECRAMHKPGA